MEKVKTWKWAWVFAKPIDSGLDQAESGPGQKGHTGPYTAPLSQIMNDEQAHPTNWNTVLAVSDSTPTYFDRA